MKPDSSRARTRLKQADSDRLTPSANWLLVMRPSSCSGPHDGAIIAIQFHCMPSLTGIILHETGVYRHILPFLPAT